MTFCRCSTGAKKRHRLHGSRKASSWVNCTGPVGFVENLKWTGSGNAGRREPSDMVQGSGAASEGQIFVLHETQGWLQSCNKDLCSVLEGDEEFTGRGRPWKVGLVCLHNLKKRNMSDHISSAQGCCQSTLKECHAMQMHFLRDLQANEGFALTDIFVQDQLCHTPDNKLYYCSLRWHAQFGYQVRLWGGLNYKESRTRGICWNLD